jgi:hypothetical protein
MSVLLPVGRNNSSESCGYNHGDLCNKTEKAGNGAHPVPSDRLGGKVGVMAGLERRSCATACRLVYESEDPRT